MASNQAILEVKGNLEATVNWVLAKLDLHGSVEMICPPDASSFNDIRWDGRAVWDNSLTGIKQILIQVSIHARESQSCSLGVDKSASLSNAVSTSYLWCTVRLGLRDRLAAWIF